MGDKPCLSLNGTTEPMWKSLTQVYSLMWMEDSHTVSFHTHKTNMALVKSIMCAFIESICSRWTHRQRNKYGHHIPRKQLMLETLPT